MAGVASTVETMSFQPGERVFVDESKARGYYIAAAATARGDVPAIEKTLRGLRHGGRSSIHFNMEGNRRDLLLREFCKLDVRVTIYVMKGTKDRIARPLLLQELVTDLVAGRAADVVLERDASVEEADRRIIRARLDQLGALNALTYGHRDRGEQSLLWIADAAAWCHQAGSPWTGKVASIVERVVTIPAG